MDITAEHSELFSSLMALIRSSNALYALDVDFVRSLNRDVAARSEDASQRLLDLINDLFAQSSSNGDGNGGNGGKVKTRGVEPPFRDVDDLTARWRSIEHALDLLIDKAEQAPAAAAAARRRTASPAPSDASSESSAKPNFMKLANNIPKPQLKFATKIDNSVGPFKPLLTQKPFANYTPLSESVRVHAPDAQHEHEWYDQPYAREIRESPFPSELSHASSSENEEEEEVPDWDSTPFTFVDTPKKLFRMISKLERANEIAVDVEHHEYRSYLGLVCLLQITGAGEDYVVDALALRAELQALNRVFANPNIIKVLHGAKMDVLWLQRDLGVYIVGLFDTHAAARELHLPKHSLAYLLQTYVDFTAQKKYQLADWRIRPLPQELVDYARADTHFLLYIYHRMRAQLDAAGKTEAVIAASREVAAQRYEKPGWNEVEPAWFKFAIKYRLSSPLQRALLVRLYDWRDRTAREHDESPRYIMSPQFLANLCITKPTTPQGVRAASHNISEIVIAAEDEIVDLIKRTCEHPEEVDTSLPLPPLEGTTGGTDGGEVAATTEQEVGATATSTTPITKLKMMYSPFMGESQPITTALHFPQVDLSVYERKDMDRAQEHNALLAQQQQELQEQRQRQDQARKEEEERRQREEANKIARIKAKVASSNTDSGKRLNIVEDDMEFDLTTEVKSQDNKTRKRVRDEPAFDFKNAKSVLHGDDKKEDTSFSRFGAAGSTGPRGKRSSSKMKRAKSFR